MDTKKLEVFRENDRRSRQAWRQTWHGNRQDDSPLGRMYDQRALEAYRALSDEERALLTDEERAEYSAFSEQSELIEADAQL